MSYKVIEKRLSKSISDIMYSPKVDDVDNSSSTSDEELIKKAKNLFLDKFYAMVRKVEEKFNVSCELHIATNDKIITINRVDFVFKVTQKNNVRLIKYESAYNKLNIGCKGFSLKLKKATFTHLDLFFNDDFSILGGIFLSRYIDRQSLLIEESFWTFCDDLNMDMSEYKLNYKNEAGKYITIEIEKNKKKLLSFDEESVLFKLKSFKNDIFNDTLPEMYVPSAYNFNSDDFNSRLNLCNMLLS